MPLAAIVSIVIATVLILALAYYLARVVVILGHVNDQLGKITFGVRAIAFQTTPIGEIVGGLNDDLTAVADAVENLVDTAVATTQESAA